MRPIHVLAPLALLLGLALDAGAAVWVLANGDKLQADLIEQTDDRVVLMHPVLGRIEVAATRVEEEKKEVNPGLFGTNFLRAWTRHFELGMSGASGNSNNNSFRLGLDMRYADEIKRWKLTGDYLYKEGDSEVDDHNATVRLTRDWLNPDSPWFWYVLGQYDWDDLKNWRNRVQIFPGIGYEVFKTKPFELRLRGAPGVVQEFGGDQAATRAELGLGAELIWRIGEIHELEASNYFFPILNLPGDYRNVGKLDWRIRLSERYGLGWVFGVKDEYESNPAEGDVKNDFRYYGSLTYDF